MRDLCCCIRMYMLYEQPLPPCWNTSLNQAAVFTSSDSIWPSFAASVALNPHLQSVCVAHDMTSTSM